MPQSETLRIESGYGSHYEVSIAGLGTRAYAFTIDWHIRILAATLWFGISQLIINQLSLSEIGFAQISSVGPAVFIYLFYHPVLELLMEGNTPGKRYAKIRVVTGQGLAPGASTIMIRNVMRLIDSMPVLYMVGIVCCLVTQRQVRIGDLAAGTLLIYDQEVEALTDSVDELLVADGLSMQQLQAVKHLLNRWSDLEVDKREQLAMALLRKLGKPVLGATDGKALKLNLEALVSS
tara:strand:+ start:260 stop:964 length:705 start_codon:yes stop_codon:yes gene_type:complete